MSDVAAPPRPRPTDYPGALVDEDAPWRALLEGVPIRPLFVVGLHRSGTTFLYESLARVLPLAPLTAHHVLCYPRLLNRFQQGTLHADQDALDAHFAALGLSDRQVDAIALSHAMVEEYGWLLQRFGGSVHLERKTRPLFDDLCRKLLVLHPGAQAALLKNPWDTGWAPQIHRLYPQARFVFIARHPLRILHSQLENALLFGGTEAEYLQMLLAGFPLGRAVIGAQRRLYRWVGRERYARLMLRVLMSDVRRELGRYLASWAALPEGCKLEVTYPALTERPAETLGAVARFFGLTPTCPLETIAPRPRARPLHPEVERVGERFLAGLRARDLLREELAPR